MDDTTPFQSGFTATPQRPLLGMTILVVEDSRFACEAMRLLCLRSGARVRRADCLLSARRHLQVYRPSAMIIDMGLPDGSGVELIEELNATDPRVSVILGMSGDDGTETAARAAGADGFLAKPVGSLVAFQQTIIAALPPGQRPSGPRRVLDETISPDPLAYRDDMTHVADLLDDTAEGPVLDYVAQFLGSVATAAADGPLVRAARELSRCRAGGGGTREVVGRLHGLVQERLAQKVAI